MADNKNISSDEDYLDSLLNSVSSDLNNDNSAGYNSGESLEDMLTDDFLSDDMLDSFLVDEADLFGEIADIDLNDDSEGKTEEKNDNVELNNEEDMTKESAVADSFVMSEDNQQTGDSISESEEESIDEAVTENDLFDGLALDDSLFSDADFAAQENANNLENQKAMEAPAVNESSDDEAAGEATTIGEATTTG